MPSFVIGEFFFITLALVSLVHALAHGRTHLLVWLAALSTGTANDAIFMFLPFVDNFWQAQARIAASCILELIRAKYWGIYY